MALIQNLLVHVELTNRKIPIDQIEDTVSVAELLEALGGQLKLPPDTNGEMVRKKTRKRMLPAQTLREIGIEDNEVLTVDYERTAGNEK